MDSKVKVRIAMLAPIAIVLTFFAYSSISALVTIKSVKIPENFDKIKVKVKNYEIYEIDRKSSFMKWKLKGKSADGDSSHTEADVKDAFIEVFEANELKFTIKSDNAQVNKSSKEIYLTDNVEVENPADKSLLEANTLKFHEESDIEVSDWSMEIEDKYEISGDSGLISSNFGSITSIGNAEVNRDNMKLTAQTINLGKEKPVIATGAANLLLQDGKKLKARKIIFNQDGTVKADGNVEVLSDNISCYSQHLDIKADKDKSPEKATFTGDPYIIKDGKTIKSDIIHYDFKTNQVLVEGNVQSI